MPYSCNACGESALQQLYASRFLCWLNKGALATAFPMDNPYCSCKANTLRATGPQNGRNLLLCNAMMLSSPRHPVG